jgi:hypothetical protein
MANDYYARVMGSVIGPMSPVELKDMASSRRISESDEVRRGTSGDWQPAATVSGLAFPANKSNATLNYRPASEESSGAGGAIAAIIVGLVIAATVVGLWMYYNPTTARERAVRHTAEAAILAGLTAPSEAVFFETTAEAASDGLWNVRGEVDAKNALGVKLRKTWTATVELNADGVLITRDARLGGR